MIVENLLFVEFRVSVLMYNFIIILRVIIGFVRDYNMIMEIREVEDI